MEKYFKSMDMFAAIDVNHFTGCHWQQEAGGKLLEMRTRNDGKICIIQYSENCMGYSIFVES